MSGWRAGRPRLAALGIACIAAFAAPAAAQWQLEEGIAAVAPVRTNSDIERLVLMCGDPYLVELHSQGGVPRPASGESELDYFYVPGRIEARIDGHAFPLVAAGSGDAVVLFGEGDAGDHYLAPIGEDFITALKSGQMLTLALDLSPDPNAEDGTGFETVAEFPLDEAAAVLDEALGTCASPG